MTVASPRASGSSTGLAVRRAPGRGAAAGLAQERLPARVDGVGLTLKLLGKLIEKAQRATKLENVANHGSMIAPMRRSTRSVRVHDRPRMTEPTSIRPQLAALVRRRSARKGSPW